MRPIQHFGASPEGLQRYLYSVSRNGRLAINARMEAMCFGTTLPRFQALLDQLQRTGAIAEQTRHANATLRHYRVAQPPGWDALESADAPHLGPPPAQDDESTGPVEDLDYFTHSHGVKRPHAHTHAWGSEPHSHLVRSVCLAEECVGCETHDVHPVPGEE